MSSKSRNIHESENLTVLSAKDRELLGEAWRLSRKHHGNTLDLYLPGMIRHGDIRGRYPAISITGGNCELLCEHCKGRLLQPMIKVETPDELVEKCRTFAGTGAQGVLLTGGSNQSGQLPWDRFLPTIERVHAETDLFLSAHTGFPSDRTCRELKAAGVVQGLIDVMGDDETAASIYHLSGLKPVLKSLSAIGKSGLQLAPHVVAGLFHGRIKAEMEALEIIRRHAPHVLVIVVLTPLKGTAMAHASVPSPLEIARIIARARLLMPKTPISLGCERPRDRKGMEMERLALLAGVNRMAVWSDETVQEAQRLGLSIRLQYTCCSVDFSEKMGVVETAL